MEEKGYSCSFQCIKNERQYHRGIAIFRLWQKANPDYMTHSCHIHMENGSPVLDKEARTLLERSMPSLEINESAIGVVINNELPTNNSILENIVSEIFADDIDQNERESKSTIVENGSEFELNLDDDKLLSQSDVQNYPIRLSQQQLLLYNSMSNRISLLFNDISKMGIPMQVIQPHVSSLKRMLQASRDIQRKIQASVKKCVHSPLSATTPDSVASSYASEKEKKRLQKQIEALQEKLQFFSTEYQRTTELYLQEKSKHNISVANEELNLKNLELSEKIDRYKVSIEQMMKERTDAQTQLQECRNQAEELEYALKVLLETGTIIPQELDDQILEVIGSDIDDY